MIKRDALMLGAYGGSEVLCYWAKVWIQIFAQQKKSWKALL